MCSPKTLFLQLLSHSLLADYGAPSCQIAQHAESPIQQHAVHHLLHQLAAETG